MSDPEQAATKASVATTKAQITASFNMEEPKLKEEADRRQSEKTKANEEEFSKIKAEANIERLRADGQAYQAEIAQAKEAFREKEVELDTKFREEHKGDKPSEDDQKTLADAKKAEAMKRDATLDNAALKEGKHSADAEVGIEKELSRLRMERLKQEAENGDANAERMLREGTIREKAKGDQLEIGKLLRDQNTTLVQRLQLVKLLDQSLTDEKKSLAKAQGDDRTAETRFEFKDAGYQTVFGQAGTPDNAAQKANTVANTDPDSLAEKIGKSLAGYFGAIIKEGFSGVTSYSGPNNDGGSNAGGD